MGSVHGRAGPCQPPQGRIEFPGKSRLLVLEGQSFLYEGPSSRPRVNGKTGDCCFLSQRQWWLRGGRLELILRQVATANEPSRVNRDNKRGAEGLHRPVMWTGEVWRRRRRCSIHTSTQGRSLFQQHMLVQHRATVDQC